MGAGGSPQKMFSKQCPSKGRKMPLCRFNAFAFDIVNFIVDFHAIKSLSGFCLLRRFRTVVLNLVGDTEQHQFHNGP